MNVLIVTEQYFPYGSAMASRLLTFCELFTSLGHKVYVIASYSSKKVVLDNIDYEIVYKRDKKSIDTFFSSSEYIDRVKKHVNNNHVDIVFFASIHINFNQLYRFFNKKNIPILLEQCEWYDVSSYKFGYLDIRYIRHNANIYHNFLRVNAVISISRLLNNHYNEHGTKSIRIPSILDVKNRKYSLETNNKKIIIVYTGNASKSKELIVPIINAIASKDDYMEKIEFHIYGLNQKELQLKVNNNSLFNKTKDCVITHGYVAQDKIENVLMNADYQIFIRPNRRSSNAGFPTKLCESFAAGTPVITNDTGDITMYLKDSVNGFICSDTSAESITKILDKILMLNKEQYNNLRIESRKTAEESFDYRNYIDEIKGIINYCKCIKDE